MKPSFDKSLFWDTDYENIDFEINARFVITRVLMSGDIDDWIKLRNYYGMDKLKNEVVQIRYLDKLTLNFCTQLFNISKERFRCYNTDQSIQELWNY